MIRAAFLSILLVLITTSAPAETPTTQPARPYKIEPLVKENPAIQGQIIRIDLTSPNLEILVAPGGPDPDGAGPWETILKPTSQIARDNQFDLAINSVFFFHAATTGEARIYKPGEMARSTALLMNQGKLLCPQRGGSSLVLDKNNNAYIAKVGKLPDDAYTIVTGDQQIVFKGRNTATKDPAPAPRTSIGLSKDNKTLIIFVVDGRRPSWSVGYSLPELADQMIALGCDNAINLDGGGSSTLVERTGNEYKVVNLPSDGSTLPIPLSLERPVPYVLGIRFAAKN